MSGQGRKLALAVGLPWHFARLVGQAALAPRPIPGRQVRKILILGYGAVGDLIFFLPTLRAIRRGLPAARLVFIGDDDTGTRELLPATDLVHEIWRYTHARLTLPSVRRELRRRVREAGFDAVAASGPTPMRRFAPAVLGVPARIGACRPIEAPHAGWSAARYALWRLKRGIVSDEFERRLSFNRKVWIGPDEEHVVSRNLRLARALGIPEAPEDALAPEIPEPEAARAFAERILPGARPAIGLHLGSPASQYSKLWPVERWAAAARAVAGKTGARVVLVGGPDEKEAARSFAAAYGGELIDSAGSCGLLESFAVIRRCRVFLSNDTGPSKAAMAMGVPTAAVWGPSDRPGWGAFWQKERHLEIFQRLPCSPCVRLGLRNEGAGVINFSNCGHRACLSELSAEEVSGEVLKRFGEALAA